MVRYKNNRKFFLTLCKKHVSDNFKLNKKAIWNSLRAKQYIKRNISILLWEYNYCVFHWFYLTAPLILNYIASK